MSLYKLGESWDLPSEDWGPPCTDSPNVCSLFLQANGDLALFICGISCWDWLWSPEDYIMMFVHNTSGNLCIPGSITNSAHWHGENSSVGAVKVAAGAPWGLCASTGHCRRVKGVGLPSWGSGISSWPPTSIPASPAQGWGCQARAREPCGTVVTGGGCSQSQQTGLA